MRRCSVLFTGIIMMIMVLILLLLLLLFYILLVVVLRVGGLYVEVEGDSLVVKMLDY